MAARCNKKENHWLAIGGKECVLINDSTSLRVRSLLFNLLVCQTVPWREYPHGTTAQPGAINISEQPTSKLIASIYINFSHAAAERHRQANYLCFQLALGLRLRISDSRCHCDIYNLVSIMASVWRARET